MTFKPARQQTVRCSTGAPRPTAARTLVQGLRTPLYRNALALLVNSGVTSLIGVVYWTLAARLTSPEVVGLNAALVSAMVVLSNLSQLGLSGGLGGLLPRAGAATGALVKSAYATAIVVGVALGTAFVMAAPRFSAQLQDLARPGVAALFVAAVVTWSLFGLQDSVLTGLRRAVWIPLENIIYSAMKLALVLALASGLGGYGIFVSWCVPAALALVPISFAVFKVFIPKHIEAYGAEPGRGIRSPRRFVAGDGLGMLLAQVNAAVIPLLVVERAGAGAGGRFYVAWMLAQSLDLVAVNVGMSLTVEGAHTLDDLPAMFRRILLRTSVLVGILVGFGVLAAPFVLALFGAGYVSASVAPLRLLLLGSLFRAVNTLTICAARAERRPSWIIALHGSLAMIVPLLAWLLTPRLGVAGAALAWTVGQAAVATLALILALPLLRRERPLSPRQTPRHLSEAP